MYGLDAGNVMNLKKIQTACNALAIQINTAQEFERGRQAQQRRAFEESKNNPAARAAGAQQANQEINAKIQENNLKRQPTQKNTGFRPAAAPATQNTQQKSTKLKRGVNFVDDDDDDL